MYLEISQIILILGIASGIVLLIVCLFLYSKAQESNRHYQLQRAFEKERIEQVEAERNLIALELHDHVCARLLTVVMDIDTLEPNRTEHLSLQTQIKDEVRSIITVLRDMAQEALPAAVNSGGPLFALHDHVQARIRTSTMKITVNPGRDDACKELTKKQSAHIYRMLMEILQNALKHSKAQNFEAGMTRTGNKITIVAGDDGIGFDPEAMKSRRNVGLYGLETRAEIIGAKLITHSAPKKGTFYEIHLTV
jgi:signal transduction histidine kinase